MKLKVKKVTLPPRNEKITLDGSTAELVDQYARYYEGSYQQSISIAELISEMVTSFIKSDRDFQKWLRNNPNMELKPSN
jgi:hypothetical protein